MDTTNSDYDSDLNTKPCSGKFTMDVNGMRPRFEMNDSSTLSPIQTTYSESEQESDLESYSVIKPQSGNYIYKEDLYYPPQGWFIEKIVKKKTTLSVYGGYQQRSFRPVLDQVEIFCRAKQCKCVRYRRYSSVQTDHTLSQKILLSKSTVSDHKNVALTPRCSVSY